MRVSTALILVYCAFAVSMGLAFAVVGPNANFDLTSYGLLLVFVAVMLTVLGLARRGVAVPFLLWLATFLFVFVCIPFVGYLLWPDLFPYWRVLFHDVASVNLALALMSVGTAALVSGYAFGARVKSGADTADQSVGPSDTRIWFRPGFFLVVALALLFVEAALLVRFSVYFAGSAVTEGAWWRRFFDFGPLGFIGTVYLAKNWSVLTKRERLLMGFPVIADLGLRTVFGARSAIVYFGFFLVQIFLVMRGDFKVGRRLAAGLAVVVLLGAVAFPVATAARFLRSEAYASGGSILDLIVLAVSSGQFDSAWNLTPVLTRLDLFGQVAIVVDGPLVPLGPHIGWVHDAQAFINMLLPGDPFPGVLDSSSVFPHVYMGVPLEYFTDYLKLTMSWTLWGLSYVRFGWAGGCVFLFTVGAGSAWLYQWIRSRAAGAFQVYVQVFAFVWSVELLNTFGLDFSAINIVYALLPYPVVLLLLWPGTWLVRTPRASRVSRWPRELGA